MTYGESHSVQLSNLKKAIAPLPRIGQSSPRSKWAPRGEFHSLCPNDSSTQFDWWSVKMHLQANIASAAEQAMRRHLAHSDQPLLRLRTLATELFAAFKAAADSEAKGEVDAHSISEMSAGFRVAFERIWVEFGGPPDRVPDIELPLAGAIRSTSSRGQPV